MAKDGNDANNENYRDDYPAVAIKLLRRADLVFLSRKVVTKTSISDKKNEQGAD